MLVAGAPEHLFCYMSRFPASLRSHGDLTRIVSEIKSDVSDKSFE